MPEDDLIAQRRRKLDELAALGVPGSNVDFKPDATLEQARQKLAAWEETSPAPEGGDDAPR